MFVDISGLLAEVCYSHLFLLHSLSSIPSAQALVVHIFILCLKYAFAVRTSEGAICLVQDFKDLKCGEYAPIFTV